MTSVTFRKVHFDESQLPTSYDALHNLRSDPLRKTRHWVKTKSLFRLVCSIALTVLALCVLRQRFLVGSNPEQDLAARDIVVGNCISLEALRGARECYEFHNLKREYQRAPPRQHFLRPDAPKSHVDEFDLKSSFGAVLDYRSDYDLFTTASADDERYTTKIAVKCLIGFSMSIVWDFEFQTSLLEAYRSGAYGINAKAGVDQVGDRASSCPTYEAESSASMSVAINCGFEVQRDAWGNPATDADHDELETCAKMAYSWVNGRIGIEGVEPFDNLCREDSDGDLKCERHVFHLESKRH